MKILWNLKLNLVEKLKNMTGGNHQAIFRKGKRNLGIILIAFVVSWIGLQLLSPSEQLPEVQKAPEKMELQKNEKILKVSATVPFEIHVGEWICIKNENDQTVIDRARLLKKITDEGSEESQMVQVSMLWLAVKSSTTFSSKILHTPLLALPWSDESNKGPPKKIVRRKSSSMAEEIQL
ncbi:MAG: hypothetical protein QE271_07805 [Bacteriovoracaceae bacterium]|nr:hypothetical protein [Bacteriovoracaceae bacterium]